MPPERVSAGKHQQTGCACSLGGLITGVSFFARCRTLRICARKLVTDDEAVARRISPGEPFIGLPQRKVCCHSPRNESTLERNTLCRRHSRPFGGHTRRQQVLTAYESAVSTRHGNLRHEYGRATYCGRVEAASETRFFVPPPSPPEGDGARNGQQMEPRVTGRQLPG